MRVLYDISAVSPSGFPWSVVAIVVPLAVAAFAVWHLLRRKGLRKIAFAYGVLMLGLTTYVLVGTVLSHRHDLSDFRRCRGWRKTMEYIAVEGKCILLNPDADFVGSDKNHTFQVGDTVFEYGLWSRNHTVTSEIVRRAAEARTVRVHFTNGRILQIAVVGPTTETGDHGKPSPRVPSR